MAHYRLYFLDHSSRIDGAHDLHFEHDHDACRHASRLGSERPWELWRGREKVACHHLLAAQAKKPLERRQEGE